MGYKGKDEGSLLFGSTACHGFLGCFLYVKKDMVMFFIGVVC